MQNGIGNGYIKNAIDELIAALGIKEETRDDEFVDLLQKGDIKLCVKKIALRLELPIEIDLQYVPKDYRPNSEIKFESRGLARTNSTGHGIESITAQVSIPGNLPLYGTSSLTDFPINVKVSENCREQPLTFITLMAHELSHILLHSLHHSKRDNEIYVDLTPMILGFSVIMDKGRKKIEATTHGDLTTTNTITYGYLADSQFRLASDTVYNILAQHRERKRRLLELAKRTRKQLLVVDKNLCRFKKFLEYLDRNKNRKIGQRDTRKIVEFHSADYAYSFESVINESNKILLETEDLLRDLIHYTGAVLNRIQKYAERILSKSNELNSASYQLDKDLKILRRNVSFVCRVRVGLQTRQYVSKMV